MAADTKIVESGSYHDTLYYNAHKQHSTLGHENKKKHLRTKITSNLSPPDVAPHSDRTFGQFYIFVVSGYPLGNISDNYNPIKSNEVSRAQVESSFPESCYQIKPLD